MTFALSSVFTHLLLHVLSVQLPAGLQQFNITGRVDRVPQLCILPLGQVVLFGGSRLALRRHEAAPL